MNTLAKLMRRRNLNVKLGVALYVLCTYFNLKYIGNYFKTNNIETNTTSSMPEHSFTDDDFVAQDLYEKVRVLCWVMTSPSNHKTKALAVRNTWGRRCNILLFMTTQEDPTLPTMILKATEGRDHLWEKSREAYERVWANYSDQVDWFFKADDDAYVLMENLRFMLTGHNTSEPIALGYKLKYLTNATRFFNSGGCGFVLSREAMKRLVEQGLNNATVCRKAENTFADDYETGMCFAKLNVTLSDTRDSLGRERFSAITLRKSLKPDPTRSDWWYLFCLVSVTYTTFIVFNFF